MSSPTALGAARVRPILAVAGLAALLAACGEATTAPTAKEAAPAPRLDVTTSKILRFTESCSGTTCTFDASSSVGFWGFTWLFLDGSTNNFAVGTKVTHTFPANGAFPIILRGTHSSGTGQVMKNVICTNGVCF